MSDYKFYIILANIYMVASLAADLKFSVFAYMFLSVIFLAAATYDLFREKKKPVKPRPEIWANNSVACTDCGNLIKIKYTGKLRLNNGKF